MLWQPSNQMGNTGKRIVYRTSTALSVLAVLGGALYYADVPAAFGGKVYAGSHLVGHVKKLESERASGVRRLPVQPIQIKNPNLFVG